MPEIVIDEEFKRLLPPLDRHTYTMLEDSILQNGCMHPLTYDIIKVTSAFNAYLQRLAPGSDATQLKTTLRSHIETLEGLYGQIG